MQDVYEQYLEMAREDRGPYMPGAREGLEKVFEMLIDNYLKDNEGTVTINIKNEIKRGIKNNLFDEKQKLMLNNLNEHEYNETLNEIIPKYKKEYGRAVDVNGNTIIFTRK